MRQRFWGVRGFVWKVGGDLHVPPEPRLLWVWRGHRGVMGELEHNVWPRVAVRAMGGADGLGSVRGVRGLPSSYASSRVVATAPGPHKAARRGGALRPVRESEVFGPGWTQAVSADHSKPSTDD